MRIKGYYSYAEGRHYLVFPTRIYVAMLEEPLYIEASTEPNFLERLVLSRIENKDELEEELRKRHLKELSAERGTLEKLENAFKRKDIFNVIKIFNIITKEIK